MPSPRKIVHRLSIVAVMAALALGIAACSSTNTASDTTTSATGAAAAVHTDAVSIKDYAFNPKTITVKAGTTVSWTNHDQFAHAVKDPATDQTGAKNIDPGATYSHTYTRPGTYPYVCAIHPNMHGTVVVTAK